MIDAGCDIAEEEPAGVLSTAPQESLKNTRLIERAIRQGWPISEDMKPLLVKRQTQIALNPKRSPREATAAFRALVQANKQNLEATRLELEIEGLIGSRRDLLIDPLAADGATITNNQINIYLPDNGRGPVLPRPNEHNGHAG